MNGSAAYVPSKALNGIRCEGIRNNDRQEVRANIWCATLAVMWPDATLSLRLALSGGVAVALD
jgi:hypothetical protein